jgi:hypothetical protein
VAKGPWNTGTWDDAQWDSLPVTGVTGTGGVGSLGTQQSVTLSDNSATGATGSVGASLTASLTGVSAVGVVGDETDSVEVALSGVGASGATGAVGLQGEAALAGVEATGATGTLTASVAPIIVIDDFHDGDKGRKKRWEAEQEKRERRKQELIAVYEQLHEGRPTIAASIVKPYVEVKSRRAEPAIDWNRLLTDIDRVEAIYREHREMDDEDVLLLL